jgi:hypothetical protein
MKNPHTLQYFCDNRDIFVLEKTSCKNGYRYKFKRNRNIQVDENVVVNLDKNLFDDSVNDVKNYRRNDRFEKIDNIPYIANWSDSVIPNTVVHWGQLKLFLGTLQFLTKYVDPYMPEVHIVYAGSAPGFNISILTIMFPNVFWYLIDPNFQTEYKDTSLKQNPNVKEIIADFFTNETAKKYQKKFKKTKGFFFISDIRISSTDEIHIFNDNKMQKDWIDIMKPEFSLLKFRIPRIKDSYEYFEGDIYIQCFAPPSSTETRLVVKRDATLTNYNFNVYDGRLFYFNKRLRCSYYPHNYSYRNFTDHCHDCFNMFLILEEYREKYKDIYTETSLTMDFLLDGIISTLLKNKTVVNKLAIDTKTIRQNIDLEHVKKHFVKK